MLDSAKSKAELVEEVRELHQQLTKTIEAHTTERKAAEEELAIFRRFAEASAEGFGMGDLDARIVYANPALCRLCGEEKLEDMIGKSFLTYYPEQWKERREKEVIPYLEKTGHWAGEQAMLSKQGRLVPTLHDVFLLRDETGKPFRRCTVITDISERKQTEDALRKSEERFRSYFEQGLMGMAVSNGEMRWAEVNNRFCEILGYSREEVLQQKIIDFVHPDDFESADSAFRQLVSGEIDHYTTDRRYLRKDGKLIHLNIYVKGFRSQEGTVDHVLALFEDVTERINAQQALRQNHDELQAIYEEMVDGIIIVDIENPFPLRANAAICRMLGYSEEELRNMTPAEVHPREVMSIVQEHLKAVKQGVVARIEDLPFLRKDGSLLYADVVSSRIFYDGRFCRISFLHDVTERKQAEEALRKEHRALKHLLQASDHERQQIAYEIHDDLAQQLAAAIMQLEAFAHFRSQHPQQAEDAFRDGLAMLRQGHFEARRLIAGVRPPVLDEAGVVEAVTHLINEQNRQEGPKIVFHSLVDFNRLVPLLENAIYRIIQEGMTNACKHSRTNRVRITLLQQKDRLRIEIRDWGIGFDVKNAKRGGFGLTGIEQRARLLGGKCRIQSAMGKGTRIVVKLTLLQRQE